MCTAITPFETKVAQIPPVAQIVGYGLFRAEPFFGTCPQLERTTSLKVMSLPRMTRIQWVA